MRASTRNRAKAWCFDNNITEEQILKAWNKALEQGVPIVKNLDNHGHTWWMLPPHLLEQLLRRYSDKGEF